MCSFFLKEFLVCLIGFIGFIFLFTFSNVISATLWFSPQLAIARLRRGKMLCSRIWHCKMWKDKRGLFGCVVLHTFFFFKCVHYRDSWWRRFFFVIIFFAQVCKLLKVCLVVKNFNTVYSVGGSLAEERDSWWRRAVEHFLLFSLHIKLKTPSPPAYVCALLFTTQDTTQKS